MKMTPWFKGEVKPVRTGVYQRYNPAYGELLWALWDNKRQLWMMGEFVYAYSPYNRASQSSLASANQDWKWRGVTYRE